MCSADQQSCINCPHRDLTYRAMDAECSAVSRLLVKALQLTTKHINDADRQDRISTLRLEGLCVLACSDLDRIISPDYGFRGERLMILTAAVEYYASIIESVAHAPKASSISIVTGTCPPADNFASVDADNDILSDIDPDKAILLNRLAKHLITFSVEPLRKICNNPTRFPDSYKNTVNEAKNCTCGFFRREIPNINAVDRGREPTVCSHHATPFSCVPRRR